MAAQERQTLTLRFDNPETYHMLQYVSQQLGVSMNRLVQEAIEERLRRDSSVIEAQLQAALDLVRRYRGEDLERYARAFAHAEVTEDDPLRATAVTPQEDPLGVRKAFVRPVE